MKPAVERSDEDIGWVGALTLTALAFPLMAVAVLLVRTLLIPLLVAGVAVMALLALFVPPRYRAWIGEGWRMTGR